YAFFDGPSTEADFEKYSSFREGFWVAEEESKLIGFAFGFLREVPLEVLTQWECNRVGEIELIAVDPKYREKGIGKSLILKVIDEFRKVSVDRVLLTCPTDATDAKRLYDSIGFEVRAYHMKLDL
ncbi:MAG: GNAT family N-acetyltransferase, partial [Candidatus Thorarchaeota archaeon]